MWTKHYPATARRIHPDPANWQQLLGLQTLCPGSKYEGSSGRCTCELAKQILSIWQEGPKRRPSPHSSSRSRCEDPVSSAFVGGNRRRLEDDCLGLRDGMDPPYLPASTRRIAFPIARCRRV